MGNTKYFTSIDLCCGYWQCHIADEDIPKTTFPIRYSFYKWVVMPIGLLNAPVMFMETMKNLFSNILEFGMAVFLDDIFVYSCMVKKNFTLLAKILVHLCQSIFYCKLGKCSFFCNSTTFLSFNVIAKGMHISDSKV